MQTIFSFSFVISNNKCKREDSNSNREIMSIFLLVRSSSCHFSLFTCVCVCVTLVHRKSEPSPLNHGDFSADFFFSCAFFIRLKKLSCSNVSHCYMHVLLCRSASCASSIISLSLYLCLSSFSVPQ
jgi:hypothetical protein